MSISSNDRTIKSKTRQTLSPDWQKAGLERKSTLIFKRSNRDILKVGFGEEEQYAKPIQYYVTGSSYEGSWNSLGFAGYGTYYFPHGAIYEGNFKDGQFHGKGTIIYPVGHKLKGIWKHGKLVSKMFEFADGLKVRDPWNYCQIPDRRFQVEFNTSLRGAGQEFLTNKQPTVDIPPNCYDTIDGFYDPFVKCIYKYDEEAIQSGQPTLHKQRTDTLKRTVLKEESNFIEKNYRYASLRNVGYRPDFYESWVTGESKTVEQAIVDMGLQHKLYEDSASLESETSLEQTSKCEVHFEYMELKTK